MNINLLVIPLQIFKMKLNFQKKVLTHPCSGVVRKSTETKKNSSRMSKSNSSKQNQSLYHGDSGKKPRKAKSLN